jgi:tellurite resistance protein TerC
MDMTTLFSTYLPVIVSLVIMEGLLSVDNALALAAMVRHLKDEEQQKKALRWGIWGAYIMRGLSLAFVAFIIANPWLKILGGLYLVKLMSSNLGIAEEGEEEQAEEAKAKSLVAAGFWSTVLMVEFADMAFSIDNVVAAVALSSNIWIVITGVFIGILAMRFVAQAFIGLINRFPILEKVAFLLVGYVGIQLLAEQLGGLEVHESGKFACIAAIIAAGLAYEKVAPLRNAVRPAVIWGGQVLGNVDELMNSLWVPFGAVLRVAGKAVAPVFKPIWEKLRDRFAPKSEETTSETNN